MSDLVKMMRGRVGSSFEDEATFSGKEVEQIIAALSPAPVQQVSAGVERAVIAERQRCAEIASREAINRFDNEDGYPASRVHDFLVVARTIEREIRKGDAPTETSPPPQDHVRGFTPTHRHKKRGSVYQVIAHGRLQVDGDDLDMERVTIYRAEDGTTWVRPNYEFSDGRFEALTTEGE